MDIIREAGIVGMGGATFPTYAKLSSGLGKVDTIIVNVSECEPYIVADDRVCQEYPAEVIKGLEIVMRILGLNKAHIAVEDNKQEAIAALKKHIDPHSEITVEALPSKYPQGAEKQLIQAITGRQVPSGGLPAASGLRRVQLRHLQGHSRCRVPGPTPDSAYRHRVRRYCHAPHEPDGPHWHQLQ